VGAFVNVIQKHCKNIVKKLMLLNILPVATFYIYLSLILLPVQILNTKQAPPTKSKYPQETNVTTRNLKL
jgi:hypothetical protein